MNAIPRLLAASLAVALSAPAVAIDMGDMMNPSKWMGGNKDNERQGDYPPMQGYPGGYGPGGYGPGYGAAPGYGAGPGYGAPGYGAPPGGYGGGPVPGADPSAGMPPGKCGRLHRWCVGPLPICWTG